VPDNGVTDVTLPEPKKDNSVPDMGHTDPPEAWPDPKNPPKPPDDMVGPPDRPEDPTDPAPEPKYAGDRKELPVLVSAWKADSFKVWPKGAASDAYERVVAGDTFEIRAGDRVQPKGAAEFTLVDGSLLRLDGQLTFDGDSSALRLTLGDGAMYADAAGMLTIAGPEVEASMSGVCALEKRLHGLDIYCISGRVSAGSDQLPAGQQARLEKDGFGRSKPIAWADVQREFKFLKDTPSRVKLSEELIDAPGKLFGGAIRDGVLAGDADGNTGIGFYLREPYTFHDGDYVRFRFRAGKACEMILQFGTVGDANWRHKMGGVKAGEWIEYELPLRDLYKTTDVAVKAQPGLQLKFFQLHPEDGTSHLEIDKVEIVHRP
jgi:hypothetical protein